MQLPINAGARPGGLPIFVTIAVVCYGDHRDLAERFFTSLYSRTDPACFTLRVGLNEVTAATASLVAEFSARYRNIRIFNEPKNIFKDPLMRRMFSEEPLETEWVIWFDDDSYVVRADWLHRLALQMERQPSVAQWGQRHLLWRIDPETEAFIKTAPWYRGMPLPVGTAPDGRRAMEFHFATGGFWAIKAAALQAIDDFLLGEALRQAGYEVGHFEYGLRVNDAPRRNATAPEILTLDAASLREMHR
jgi:GT2 family glycosyltransferase